jgi:hypothetical protein
MSPEKAIFAAFAPDQRILIEQSFWAAWDIVRPRHIEAGSSREAELRLELARCLAKLASDGFRNSDELTKRCVEDLLLGPRH